MGKTFIEKRIGFIQAQIDLKDKLTKAEKRDLRRWLNVRTNLIAFLKLREGLSSLSFEQKRIGFSRLYFE